MSNISIIMPLYNAERYLAEALRSVLKQTYEDFELICIDDCSTDRTRTIVEEFMEKDARIRILKNEENLGAAPSRNKGIEAAKGEYVLFLDGDDVFEEELLEKVSSAMEKYQTDMVLFEYLHAPSGTIYEKKVVERSQSFIEKYCETPFSMISFEPRDFLWWSASPCNRIFRRSFIEKNRLEFQNLPSGNDVYFAQMSLFCATKIICLNDRRVMVYARDHSEPQRISNNRNPMCTYYAMEKLCRELKERGMLAEYAPYLYFRLSAYFMYTLSREKNEERKKSFYDFLHEKGVLQCIEYGKEYYEKIAEYDKYLLESLQKNAFESRWFDHRDTYFHVYLRKYGNTICQFIKDKNLENKKIILWGVGADGKILLNYLAAHDIKIFGIADRNKRKQGIIVNGYEILDPNDFYKQADYVIATSDWVYQEICIAINNTGIVAVNLLEMLKKKEKETIS